MNFFCRSKLALLRSSLLFQISCINWLTTDLCFAQTLPPRACWNASAAVVVLTGCGGGRYRWIAGTLCAGYACRTLSIARHEVLKKIPWTNFGTIPKRILVNIVLIHPPSLRPALSQRGNLSTVLWPAVALVFKQETIFTCSAALMDRHPPIKGENLGECQSMSQLLHFEWCLRP